MLLVETSFHFKMIVTFTINNLVFRIDHFKLSFFSFEFVLNSEILVGNTEILSQLSRCSAARGSNTGLSLVGPT